MVERVAETPYIISQYIKSNLSCGSHLRHVGLIVKLVVAKTQSCNEWRRRTVRRPKLIVPTNLQTEIVGAAIV